MPSVIDLKTAIPGPKSRALIARRPGRSPGACRSTTPIAVVSGRERRDHRRGRQPADRFRRRHRRGERRPPAIPRWWRRSGSSWISSPTSASRCPRTSRTSALAERLNALTPGGAQEATFFVNSGAEAVENAVKVARYFTGRQADRLLRACLPRPHLSRHGADVQGDALQEGVRAVRARGVPDAVSLLLSLSKGGQGGQGGKAGGLLHGEPRVPGTPVRGDGGSRVGRGDDHGAGARRRRVRSGAEGIRRGRWRRSPRITESC